MMFFIHHVQTYSNVNKKGREMCEFAKAFDRLLITDQCALDSLKCSFEAKVNELNQKYPKTKAITFSAGVFDSQDGRFSVRVGNDDNQSVCFISYVSVRGYYSFGEGMLKTQTLVTPGVCGICGCTENDPCFHPDHGTCWWADESQTICSHCADTEISADPATEHCINSKGGKQ